MRTIGAARLRRPVAPRLAPVALLLIVSGCGAGEPPGPDLVLTEGVARLGDLRAPTSAIALDDGRIVATGADAEVRGLANDDTQEMPLDGAAVLPGLVDAWVDLEAVGRWQEGLDLRRAASAREVQALLRAATPAASGWIVGWGWDETLWPDSRLPDRSTLDPLGDTPVLLLRRIGAIAWVNTAALESAGLLGASEADRGVRVDSNGSPTGIITGDGLDRIRALAAQPSRPQRRAWIEAGARAAAAAGITTAMTVPVDLDTHALLREMDADAELPIRVEVRLLPGQTPPESVRDDGLVSIRGYGMALDGPLRPAMAALAAADANGQGATIEIDADALARACAAASDAGLVMDVRAHGDRAVENALAECPSLAAGNGMLIGADILPAGFASGAVRIAILPLRLTHDLYWIDELLGVEVGRRAHAYRSLLSDGLLAAFASSSPEHDLDTTAWLLAVSTRRDRAGYPLDGWHPDERISVGDALRVATGGRVMGGGDDADLVVWSADPLDPETRPADLRVMMTIVGGRVVYSRPLVEVPFDIR